MFAVQKRDRPVDQPPVSRPIGRDTVHFFPGFTPENEPILSTLRDIPALGTTVRVAMLAWHSERGTRLADLLAEKARAGADVRVIEGPYIGSNVRDVLTEAGVDVVSGVCGTTTRTTTCTTSRC